LLALHRGWALLVDFLTAERPCWVLLLANFALGCACAASVLPVDVVTGTSPFWNYPGGIDEANVLVGYRYLIGSPWGMPLLHAPLLGPEPGTNVFWLDIVPWLALVGKALSGLIGVPVNPYGLHLFACLSLPAMAMAALLVVGGQRTLLAALSGGVLVESTPYLWWRAGHFALLSHYLIIFGLALYLFTVRGPARWRLQLGWGAFLVLALLTNIYLFVMVAGLWAAALAQTWLDGRIGVVCASICVGAVVIGVLGVMLLTGQYSRDLAAAGTDHFGMFSMNLLSPIVPQMSGDIPFLARFTIGVPGQGEGFAYLGLGVLLLLCGNAHAAGAWITRRGVQHAALITVLAAYILFALSNKVYAGNWLILDMPIPPSLAHALGTFRGSGRFFWPVGYAAVALLVTLTLRNYRPGRAIAILSLAALIQWVDVGPLRASVREKVTNSVPSAFDRGQLAVRMAEATEVVIVPSFICTLDAATQNIISVEARDILLRQNLELQLAAAEAKRRTNSVYAARDLTNCASQQKRDEGMLRPRVLYIFLRGFDPPADQWGEKASCEAIGDARFCEIADRQ
jgi:hypothetical protein